MNNLTIIEILFLLFIVFFLAYLYFIFLHHFLPMEKQIKYSTLARGHEFVLDKYDWPETFKRHRIFLLTITALTFLVLVLSHSFSIKVAYVGIWLIVIILLLLAKWVGPVKKTTRANKTLLVH